MAEPLTDEELESLRGVTSEIATPMWARFLATIDVRDADYDALMSGRVEGYVKSILAHEAESVRLRRVAELADELLACDPASFACTKERLRAALLPEVEYATDGESS